MSYSKSDEPYMNKEATISPVLMKLELDNIEEYALELYSIFDSDGAGKWHSETDQTQEYYRSRSRYLISQGFKKG